ncbi:MAG TPA: UdgX family uracil-DNA binding protein [Dokdonella sp.]
MAANGPRVRKPGDRSRDAATAPPAGAELARLGRAARKCRACPLWEHATQTVFGQGPADASLMFVGEQAGDREDLDGHPFVGPAGRLLDGALAEVGIERSGIYVTNVIKHFKFELRGKRRLHKRANAAEIDACLRWLRAEIDCVRPRHVVCLGALAARVMLGAAFKLQQNRGRWFEIGDGRWCLATVHPSFVLRSRIGGGYEETYRAFVADLARVRRPPA